MQSAKMRLASVCLAMCVALAACGTSKTARSDDQRMASGQVLKGSISDAMLPYDSTRSQPPRAPREASESAAKGGEDAGSEASSGEAKPDAPKPDAPKPDAAAPSPN